MTSVTSETDPGYLALTQEFRKLRGRPGALTGPKLALCPYLCLILGENDPYKAYEAIQDLAVYHKENREIVVALRSIGLFPKDVHTSVEDRLLSIGADYYFGPRQTRRLCDEGIKQLVALLLYGRPQILSTLQVTAVQVAEGFWSWVELTNSPASSIKSLYQTRPDGKLESVDLKLVQEMENGRILLRSSPELATIPDDFEARGGRITIASFSFLHTGLPSVVVNSRVTYQWRTSVTVVSGGVIIRAIKDGDDPRLRKK